LDAEVRGLVCKSKGKSGLKRLLDAVCSHVTQSLHYNKGKDKDTDTRDM
jgi:hypothetical protein